MIEAPRPALAILIATHNRKQMLRRCLDALARQSAEPGTFEVIVADDGSDDGTAAALEQLRMPYRLQLLRLEKVGKPAALNAALRETGAERCLFLDDDVIAEEDLVAEHVRAGERDPRVLALGRLIQRPPSGRDLYAEAAAVRWNRRYEELASGTPDWADCYGANFSAHRETLLEIGDFAADLEAVEDLEIGFRLSEAGCSTVYLPAAEALHDDEKPGSRILEHERRFGSWCAGFAAERPRARTRLLGWFAESTPREVTLRRLLLGLGAAPAALARAGRLAPSAARQTWFDFVARYAFWHGVKTASDEETWRQTIAGVPVLMYHAFTDGGERDRYVLPRKAFARQMALLALLRYRVVGFDEIARALREGRPLPRRAVAITIDDGYRDNFEIAYPILRRHGFTATLFLVSGKLGARADWSSAGGPTDGRPLLSVEQVEEMRREGIAIGAHTRTHRPLPTLDPPQSEAEVIGSRTDLEQGLNATVDTFAYPYGELDEAAVSAVTKASFLGACTTRPSHARLGDDPLLVPRIEVWGSDTIPRFLRKLWLGGQ